MILDHKAPQSYLVELDRGQRRWMHAHKLRSYHARVNAASVLLCDCVSKMKTLGRYQGQLCVMINLCPVLKLTCLNSPILEIFKSGWLDSAQIFCGSAFAASAAAPRSRSTGDDDINRHYAIDML